MKKERYERPLIQKMNTGLMNKFGSRTEFEPMTHIEGLSVKHLTETYGSPLFVLAEKQIRHNFRNIHRVFSTRYPKVQVAWSYKTNYMNAICRIFHKEGAWAEVVSGTEYDKAIKNGIHTQNIIFNGPAKSEEDLLKASQNGSLIHIDHQDELLSLLAICEKYTVRPKVAVRVNMDTGLYPKWDRFGFNYENGQAWTVIERILQSGTLDLCGLHCHIGTFILSPEAYRKAAEVLCELSRMIKNKYKKSLEYLDLGGGFPSRNTLKGAYLPGTDTVPSIDQYADAITDTILNFGFGNDELPTLILEPGRYLIDDAGYLLGTVLATKRLSDNRRATILDFGVNSLFTSFWYDHKISPAQSFGEYTEEMVLFGPLCMNIDIVRESTVLPPLSKGDKVVVHRVGAYNMTQWMQFITLRPAIVLIDLENSAHIIRKAENLEYIEQQEELPDYLH